MAGVGHSRAPIARAVANGRQVAGAPEWLLVSGALLGAISIVEVVVWWDYFGTSPTVGLLLGLCATVPIAVARPHVLAAGATITVATLLTLVAQGRPTGAGLIAQVTVFYLVGREFSWRASALMLAPLVVYAIAAPPDGSSGDRLFPVAVASLALVAIVLGGARRIRGEAVEHDVARRAFADTVLENAARSERARIARELHDVVAHHISMIAVQADTARLTTSGMPAEGADRLVAIGDTARAALTEMRRLLGVLREDAGADPMRKPQPGLQQLIELVDESRDSSGASIRLIVRGFITPLDPGIELTAFRIVQEALTNARRHAPGAPVDVELDYAPGSLCLRIRDNGPGPRNVPATEGPTSGHGLLGMRERAAMVGGRLSAGPSPGSGFLVEARLPASRAPSDTAGA